ncbi:hypothetical protein BHU16_05170 [Tannerella sp. oral taxon 808]|nr:hypothetical protein BHU16_05170 [Tannerella sp. oral taxon 808]
MDSESLRIILDLQRENTLLKRGIEEAVAFVCCCTSKGSKKEWIPIIPEFELDSLQYLFEVLNDRLYKSTE